MPFYWTAQLKDQTFVPEENTDGSVNPFTLVLDAEKQNTLEMLHLTNENHNYAVDLKDGSFYIDDIRIDLIPEWRISNGKPPLLPKDPNFRVIFYRRKRQDVGPYSSGEEYIYAYLLGWQITLNEINYQRIIFIYPINDGKVKIEFREKR